MVGRRLSGAIAVAAWIRFSRPGNWLGELRREDRGVAGLAVVRAAAVAEAAGDSGEF
jgi:hypothetical protein